MKTLIKGAMVVNADGSRTADVLICDGRIAGVGREISDDGACVINAQGLWLMPGLVDLHAHLRDPGFEYKEDIISGAAAAAAGGFTSVLCMANTHPVNDNSAVTQYIVNKAKTAAGARVYPIASVTKGMEGKELTEMADLRAAGAVAVSDDGLCVADAALMQRALVYAAQFGLMVITHPEDKRLSGGGVMNQGKTATLLGLAGIPASAEESMIARDIILSGECGCPVHIAHVSTAGGVALIKAAKERGVRVTCETAPHYLTLTDAACDGYDTNAKVNPPLRGPDDREALIAGLRDGVIDCIATDHAPHHQDEKMVEFASAASGISGFETAFAACYTRLVKRGHMGLEQLVRLMCQTPAELAGIEGGRVAEGGPADVILADFEPWTVDRHRLLSKGKNTPMHGMTLDGRVLMTFVGGRRVYDAGIIGK